MTSTSNRTGGVRRGDTQVLRAAGQQLLSAAGNQVLKGVVDRAVGRVDRVAGRLDAIAAGDEGKPSVGGQPQRPAQQRQGQGASPIRVKVGAAFNLVIQQALRLLQLIQRLAQQVIAALARIFRRGDEGESTAEVTDTQGMRPRRQVDQTEPAGGRSAARPRPAGGQLAREQQAPRRRGPRPAAAREATGAPRRVAGDRPVRAARND